MCTETVCTLLFSGQFAAVTADPRTFIEQVIAETNQGYSNSGVPLRARLHCAIQTDLPDGMEASQTLAMFKNSKNKMYEMIRHSADASILLVNQYRCVV